MRCPRCERKLNMMIGSPNLDVNGLLPSEKELVKNGKIEYYHCCAHCTNYFLFCPRNRIYKYSQIDDGIFRWMIFDDVKPEKVIFT